MSRARERASAVLSFQQSGLKLGLYGCIDLLLSMFGLLAVQRCRCKLSFSLPPWLKWAKNAC